MDTYFNHLKYYFCAGVSTWDTEGSIDIIKALELLHFWTNDFLAKKKGYIESAFFVGDGLLLVFNDFNKLLELAFHIIQSVDQHNQRPDEIKTTIAMGISSSIGESKEVSVNIGSIVRVPLDRGIMMAKRLKDLANENQILLTQEVYNDIRYQTDINTFLQKLKVIKTEHDDERIYCLSNVNVSKEIGKKNFIFGNNLPVVKVDMWHLIHDMVKKPETAGPIREFYPQDLYRRWHEKKMRHLLDFGETLPNESGRLLLDILMTYAKNYAGTTLFTPSAYYKDNSRYLDSNKITNRGSKLPLDQQQVKPTIPDCRILLIKTKQLIDDYDHDDDDRWKFREFVRWHYDNEMRLYHVDPGDPFFRNLHSGSGLHTRDVGFWEHRYALQMEDPENIKHPELAWKSRRFYLHEKDTSYYCSVKSYITNLVKYAQSLKPIPELNITNLGQYMDELRRNVQGMGAARTNMQGIGSTVFICYTREDSDAAKRLYIDLTNAGKNPWLDEISILPGQVWKTEIRKAIKNSRYFIAMLSNSVGERGLVQEELKFALEVVDEVPEFQIFVIPARLNECTFPYEKLMNYKYVDLFPNWDEGVQKILRSME
jgi:hypothetical protein